MEWKYIQKVLSFFNFGPSLKHWIETVYAETNSQVLNNGWATAPFILSRGVRQGCPLSPYLFLISAEILGIIIRQNDKIEGVKMEDKEYKVSQYVDDTCLTIKANKESLQEVIDVFKRFEKYAGSKVNYDKTEIMPIGNLKDTQFKLKTSKRIKWTNGPVKLLGIMITSDTNKLANLN